MKTFLWSFSSSTDSRRAVVSYWQKYGHLVLVDRLGGLSLPINGMVKLTDRLDMTIVVYCVCKAATQNNNKK